MSSYRYQSPCTDIHTGKVVAQSWQSQVLTFTPRPDGTLSGQMTTTVETGECGSVGLVAITPLELTRIADLPPGFGN